MAVEKLAIEDDLPKQFEAGLRESEALYLQLFNDPSLNFNQACPWHKRDDGVLVPPSHDEEEGVDEDGVFDATKYQPTDP